MQSDRAASDLSTADTVDKLGKQQCQPLYPPTPMIGHLTNEEIEALNDVFSRMEIFEAEESARIRYALIHLSSCHHEITRTTQVTYRKTM